MIYQTEETRAHILRVAEELFLERGFFQTQMKDVAQAVGISRNSLYRYFRDKGDLGFAILDLCIDRVAASFRETLDAVEGCQYTSAREKLVDVLSRVLLDSKHDTDMTFMAEFDAFYSSERLPQDFSQRQNLAQWQPVGEMLASIILDGIDDSSIRDDIDPALLLWLVLTTVRIMRREIATRGAALALPEQVQAEKLLPTLITLLTDGLRPR